MLLQIGVASRLLLLLYGEIQDRLSPVKYTDIDYKVYTDAAAFVAEGLSPYLRSTYRYSPLLACTLVPNVLLHPAWGKTLFCAADLWAAWLIGQVLSARRVPANLVKLSIACWLFNPFTIAISTRGSGEAVVAVQVLLMLRCLAQGHFKTAALLLGFAVHWRVYPIIYSLPIMLWLPPATISKTPQPKSILPRMQQQVSRPRVHFAVISAMTFWALGVACYAAYGDVFLNETYLYHSKRKDPRHNFSIYFYNTYLTYHLKDRASWLAPVTQIVTTGAIGIKYAHQLHFCMMLQTIAFVAFNKVCTAQYFVWWFTLLPLVLPETDLSANGMLQPLLLWVLSQLHWLFWAYLLEFQGRAVHLQVWFASIIISAGNVYLMSQFIQCTHAPHLRPSKAHKH